MSFEEFEAAACRAPSQPTLFRKKRDLTHHSATISHSSSHVNSGSTSFANSVACRKTTLIRSSPSRESVVLFVGAIGRLDERSGRE